MQANTRWLSRFLVVVLVIGNAAALHRLDARLNEGEEPHAVFQAIEGEARRVVPNLRLTDRPTLVLLVDSDRTAAVTAARDALREASTQGPIAVVIVSPNPYAVVPASDSRDQVVIRIAADPITGLERLGISGMWNRWHVFDRHGIRLAGGDLTLGGVISGLMRVTTGDGTPTSEVVASELDQLFHSGGLTAERRDDDVRPEQDQVVMLVARASTSCPIATVFAKMRQAAARNPGASFSVLVPSDWGAAETDALRSTFDLAFEVKKANERTTEVWNRLERVYGEAQLSAFLTVLTPDGVGAVHVGATSIFRFLDDLTR